MGMKSEWELPQKAQLLYEAVFTFPNYQQGWEMDEWSWIVKDRATGELSYASTAHGRFFVTESSRGAHIILDYISEYKKAILQAETAYQILWEAAVRAPTQTGAS